MRECTECGRPARRICDVYPSLPDSDGYLCHCSDECSDAAWSRGLANGSIIAIVDLTPERTTALLADVGLLVDAGPIAPS